MRSSSSQPEPPRADSGGGRAGAWLLLVCIGLVPLLWLPGFHSGFEAPRRTLALAVVAPLAVLLAARSAEARTRARGPALAIVAVMLAGILPHLGSLDVHTAWRSARCLGAALALVLAGATLWRPRLHDALGLAIVLPAIPVLAIGLARRHLGVPEILPDRPDVALASTIGNSNALGEAFAGVFLAGLVLAPRAAGRAVRALMGAGCLAALALVVLSWSRGAWLATACGLLVQLALWWWPRRADRRFVARTAAAAGAAVVLAGAWLALPAGAGAREVLASYVSPTHPTNAVRIATWKASAALAADAMPFGVGLGAFEAGFLPYRTAAEWRTSGVDTRVDSPHQEALWIASEAGIPGLLAAAALLAIALSRALRARDPSDPRDAARRRALLLATVALVVLCAFRSPLHHPSALVAFAVLLGAAAPRAPAARRAVDVAAVPVVAALALLSVLDAAEDARLGRAISALNAAKGAGPEGDRAALLLESGRRLKTVPSAILKDFDRSFRAALAAGELADVRAGLEVAAPSERFPDLPTQHDVRDLLEEVLRLCPLHPGATNQLAYLWLKNGSVARAVSILEEAVATLPAAPRFRQNLASMFAASDRFAEAHAWMKKDVDATPAPEREQRLLLSAYALGLGREGDTMGRYLAPLREPPRAAIPGDAPLPERREALLLHLLEHPDDGLALADLARTDWTLAARTDGGGGFSAEGNLAFARSRVRFAVEAIERGDADAASGFLDLAAQKDPALLDVMILRARIAAREGRREEACDRLRAVLDRGVRGEALRAFAASDADLGPCLRAIGLER